MSEQRERMPKKEYFTMRMEQAIKSGNVKKAEYYRSRLDGMSEQAKVEVSNDKYSKCKQSFKGLNEGERINMASDFISHVVSKGGTVNQAIAFISEANVMSGAELMQAVTITK